MSSNGGLSLHRRLLLGALVVAVLFLGLTGVALDQAFRSSLAQAERERLQNHVYTLLAAARVEDGALRIPGDLPDGRFAQAGGGLYGRISDADGDVTWRSGSLSGLQWPRAETAGPGDLRFGRLELNQEQARSLGYGVRWSDPDAGTREYTVEVAESRLDSREELSVYRRTLWGWLIAAGVGLLLSQALLQHWGLRPLRRLVRELRDVRQGRKAQLDAAAPPELVPLADGVNRLLRAERERRRQYQTSLADLAHSLKTPLAVLRGTLETGATHGANREGLEQVERIDGSVRYHLARAGRSRERLGERTPLRPVAERLLRALSGQRTPVPDMELDCGDDVVFPGPEDELMELLGNVLDNAVRHCRHRVRVAATVAGGSQLEILVEDDGPGIPADARERVTRRGERADTRHPGEGIGLAVVADLVAAYSGTLELSISPLGGARISLRVPLLR